MVPGPTTANSPEALALSRKIQRYAVIIGISDYKHSPQIADLRFAAKDAKVIYDFLTSPAGGGFPRGNVKLLLDRNATIINVRSALNDFLAAPVEDDLVLIYFGGHGSADPKNPQNLYLICHDTHPDRYGGTALPMREIDLALKWTIRSKRVIVMTDACHAAGIGGGVRDGDTKASAKKVNEYWRKLAESRTGITKIAASEADQVSQENVRWGGGHGVFTHFLLKALKGEADGWIDNQRDGFVTIAEAYEFLRDKVRRETRNAQSPWASPYKDHTIPLGVIDPAVQQQVAARQRVEERERPTQSQGSYSSVQVPVDSDKAIALAMAYLKRGKDTEAREIIDAVLARHDKHEPDALAIKVDFLLQDGDVEAAEDLQLRLMVNYPEHERAKVAARVVYDYYRGQMAKQQVPEQIKILSSFLKRNPDSAHAAEAAEMYTALGAKLKSSYEEMVAQHVRMADQRCKRRQFDKARKDMEQARATIDEALRDHALRIDSMPIDRAMIKLVQAERQADFDEAFQTVKLGASRSSLIDSVLLWQKFLRGAEGSPHVDQARATLAELKQKLSQELQAKLDQSVTAAGAAIAAKRFADARTSVTAAKQAASDAERAEDTALTGLDRIGPLERLLTDAESKDKEYRAFAQFETRAGEALDAAGRIKVWQEFLSTHSSSSYVSQAKKRLVTTRGEVKSEVEAKIAEHLKTADAARGRKDFATARRSIDAADTLLRNTRQQFGSTMGVDLSKVLTLRKRILAEQGRHEDDLAFEELVARTRAAVQPGRASGTRFEGVGARLAGFDKAKRLCDEHKTLYPTSAHLPDLDKQKAKLDKDRAEFLEIEYLRAIADARTAWRQKDASTTEDALRVALLLKPHDAAAKALAAQLKPVLVVTTQPAGAKVYVDGRLAGTAPVRYDQVLKGRSYEVRVDKRGWSAPPKRVTVAAGGPTSVSFDMKERSTMELAANKIPKGEGASFGNWIVWRPEDDRLLLTHAGDEIAIEIITDSNGWFRFVAKADERICWSSGETESQSLGVPFRSFYRRTANAVLTATGCKIDEYTIRFVDGSMHMICSADNETVIVAPRASAFRFHTYDGKDVEFPSGRQTTPAKPVRPVAAGGVSIASLPQGQGAKFGQWTLWKPVKDYVVLTHPTGPMAVEVWLQSNGWYRLGHGDSQYVVWSSGEKEAQNLRSDYKQLARTRVSATLAQQECKLQEFQFRFSGGNLELICDADKETIIISPNSSSYQFRSYQGKLLTFPSGQQITGSPTPARVPATPRPVATGGVSIGSLAEGEGARFGDWTLWKSRKDYVLLTHPTGPVAVEVWLQSNGWYRLAHGGEQWVVWSKGNRDPQNLHSDYKRLAGTPVSKTLAQQDCKLLEFQFRFTGGNLELICDADSETIIISPNSSSYHFRSYKGKLFEFPSGREASAGSVPAPVRTTGTQLRADRLTVGNGMSWGDWAIWHVRKDTFLMTYPKSELAIECVMSSNGWFRFAVGDTQRITWSTGETEAQDLGVQYKGYFTRRPSAVLAQTDCTVSNYKVAFSNGSVHFTCKADNETISLAPHSGYFNYRTYRGKDIRFPTGTVPSARPRASRSTRSSSSRSIAADGISIGQGAEFGKWAIWRPRKEYILVVNGSAEIALELWVESNGWFRMAAKGSQVVCYSDGDKVKQTLNSDFAALFQRTPGAKLTQRDCEIGEYKFRFSRGKLKIICKADDETITITPSSSYFNFHTFDNKDIRMP